MGNRAEDEAIRRLDFTRKIERGQAQIGAYATRLIESLSDKERAVLRKRLGTMPLEPTDRKTLEDLLGNGGTTNESKAHLHASHTVKGK
jgi:DNA-directed RNA polymerase sigma subunit (sigma70/sigma32)